MAGSTPVPGTLHPLPKPPQQLAIGPCIPVGLCPGALEGSWG